MQETPEAEQTAVKTGDYTPQNRLVSDNLSRGPLQATTTYMEKMLHSGLIGCRGGSCLCLLTTHRRVARSRKKVLRTPVSCLLHQF